MESERKVTVEREREREREREEREGGREDRQMYRYTNRMR